MSAVNPSSDDGDAGTTVIVDAAVPEVWPPEPEPLADCPESSVEFTTATPQRSGDIAIDLSSWVQPTGVDERAHVSVLDSKGKVDGTYNGALHWTLPSDVSLIDAPAVVAGQADVTLRFASPGTRQLQASLEHDARTGAAGVIAYTTQLEVWELQVDEKDFARIIANPDSDEEIPGTIAIDHIDHPTTVRLHGASSRTFPKKSFRFELSDMGHVTGTYGKKLILRSEYNDRTLLRNWLAYRMFYAASDIPTPRSKLVHFRVNGRYYGVMHNVEHVDDHLLDRWKLAHDGSMYEGDPIDSLASPGANLTPLKPDLYPSVYQHQSGSIDYTDLRTLIEQTLVLPDAQLAAVIEQEIVVDDYVTYLAVMAALQNIDDVQKNYYLYRDPAGTLGWQTLPWDLDLTFGHMWSQANGVLDEEMTTDSDIFMGTKASGGSSFYNQMTDRVLGQSKYRSLFRTRLNALFDSTFTSASANAQMQQVIRCATPDIAGDSQKRGTNADYMHQVSEIVDFIDDRAAYVRSQP